MEVKLNHLRSRYLLKYILIPFLLIIPILLFVIPTITFGTGDIRMIKHFSQDEASLVEFAGKTYSKLFVPLEDNVTYPQLFYYLAGTILIPYTFLEGVNYQIIVIGLRSLDLLAALISTVVIYFFCLRFFKSIKVGILSSLLFTTTPIYLGWLTISRPHPLEILFILVTFYYCFKTVAENNIKIINSAIIFSGLATATKFGGLFLIAPLIVTYLYLVFQQPTVNLIESLRKKIRLIYIIASTMLIFTSLIPYFTTKLYLKFQNKFNIFNINNLSEFIHSRNFRLLLLVSISLFLFFLFWSIINFFSNKACKINYYSKNKLCRFLIITDKTLLFLFTVIFVNMLIFLIFNPAYLIFPMDTIKQMGIQFAKTTMSTSLNAGLNKPIIDLAALEWLKMLFGDFLLNKWFGLLFICYFFYEFFYFKINLLKSYNFIVQRSLFWSYIVVLLLFLIIFVFHRADQYLIPITAITGILISFSIFEIPNQIKIKSVKYLIITVLVFLMSLGFYNRTKFLIERFNIKKEHKNDTGVLIGRWLEKNFDSNFRIWTDSDEFYIPLTFKHVSFMYWHEDLDNHIHDIITFEPDLLLITSPYDPLLQNSMKLSNAIKENKLKGFQLVKKFSYEGSYAKQGVYKEIFVFTKNIQGRY